jgi:catechol 2,3-dioxygenase-like lactoylglutathione lyase family enzyme
MPNPDGSLSFYFFDIDDNLLFLPTTLYLWNPEEQREQAVNSGEFARIQNDLGRAGQWHAWAIREETFRDFRDRPDIPAAEQSFLRDLMAAAAGTVPWKGPSWPLLIHAAQKQRPIAMVTARGHEPATIEAGLHALVSVGHLPAVPPILGIYTVSNIGVRAHIGATDPALTVPSVKKMAIKHAVDTALERYGTTPPHRFGMSDDDPNNVVLAISAMRDCKLKHPDKRFFVINTNHLEFVKLEVFPMEHPATAPGEHALQQPEQPAAASAPMAGGAATIYVSTLDHAIDFYTSALGLPLRTRIGDEWAEIDAGRGLVIGLHPARVPSTPAPGTVGAINIELAVTEPIETVVAALTARGVKVDPIQSYENVRLATFYDPDGNPLLLAQQLNSGTPA